MPESRLKAVNVIKGQQANRRQKNKQAQPVFLFENFSNARIGMFTGLLPCFVACVLYTENYETHYNTILLR